MRGICIGRNEANNRYALKDCDKVFRALERALQNHICKGDRKISVEIIDDAFIEKTIAQHVDEDDALKQGLTDSLGRTQPTIFINDSGGGKSLPLSFLSFVFFVFFVVFVVCRFCRFMLFGIVNIKINSASLKKYWINPLMSAKKVSLRARNLNPEPIKVNDKASNPVLIGMVLVWRLKDTYKALFDIDSETTVAQLGGMAGARMNMFEKFVALRKSGCLRKRRSN